MTEGQDTQTAEQEKVPRKRTRRSASDERTRQRKAWTLRELGGKPLWDWMGLLIVPFMLALVTVVFTWYQDGRQNRIEAQRAASTLKTEKQRAQDAALQAYLDQMGDLLLAKDSLRESEEGSEVRTLARARTITVLGRLDAKRRTAVMQFLVEAELVQSVEGRGPIIRLSGANLSAADLSGADLRYADLSEANLLDADLSNANLLGADLSDPDLSDADYTDLSGANLSNALLQLADLSGAVLSDAVLSDAVLNWADLSDARGITKEQLEQQGAYLEGATMPDGSKHP
jgi:hypothetical protein